MKKFKYYEIMAAKLFIIFCLILAPIVIILSLMQWQSPSSPNNTSLITQINQPQLEASAQEK